MAGPPEFVAKRIQEIGEVFNPDVVSTIYDIYIPLLRAAPTDGVIVKRDIAYGPNKRHLLDIHTPVSLNNEPAPAVVYLHGGGFVRGHKNAIETEPDLIHGNIATFFARHDIIGINATYRLAPEPLGGTQALLARIHSVMPCIKSASGTSGMTNRSAVCAIR